MKKILVCLCVVGGGRGREKGNARDEGARKKAICD